jgi:hypothetical protein
LAPAPVKKEAAQGEAARTPRAGKKAVVGYFSPNVSKALRLLAIERNSNIQALIGEAIDELMRKHGKHPFGER